MIVRFMKPNEQGKLPADHLEHRDTKQFTNVWTRFGNWKKHPPVVAVLDKKIVGFHAATFNKKIYVNSYYQFVSSEARGKGVGGRMFLHVLTTATIKGLNRFKAAARIDGDGDIFYQGFGMKPIARDKDHNYYDMDIYGLALDTDLRKWCKSKNRKPVLEKEMQRHKKLGRVLL